jgi:uncharacterized protein with NAD-binding domain and iron-sulfur cluster
MADDTRGGGGTAGERTRREVLRLGVAATAATAATASTWSFGGLVRPAGAAGNAVAIFGGGVAGLSAAHELIERGFPVTVYERKALGGKARTIGKPGSGTGGRPDLPGEHGFRFFPGFYHNLGETMRRIPYPGKANGTWDNLVRATRYLSSREDMADATVPFSLANVTTPTAWLSALRTLLSLLDSLGRVSASEIAFFAEKLLVYLTSCDERRLGQWEHMPYDRYVGLASRSAEYGDLVGDGLVRNLAATKSHDASTHSVAYVAEATFLSWMGRGNEPGGFIDRVLNGPTTEKWLDPWVAYLQSRGVRFEVGWAASSIQLSNRRVSGVIVTNTAGASKTVTADWYVCAMPSERAAPLMNAAVVAADPRLANIARLRQDWMTGLVFFLREPFPVVHGHVNYVDSPFAVTSISQQQFWDVDLRDYGDGQARESFSTIVSDWDTPGVLYGKTAKQCTEQELVDEVWEQIKRHVNDSGPNGLTDGMRHSWLLDPSIINPGTPGIVNDEPLFIQQPGSWNLRPDSVTGIGNLFLAGDWVRTNINVTTMEGANAGGRQAANGVLAASGSSATRAKLTNLYVPPEFTVSKANDRLRYRLGLPNFYDVVEPYWP